MLKSFENFRTPEKIKKSEIEEGFNAYKEEAEDRFFESFLDLPEDERYDSLVKWIGTEIDISNVLKRLSEININKEEALFTLMHGGYFEDEELVDHLFEISEYSNKESLVLTVIQRSYEASENLINHLSEISEYSNKEDLVLNAVRENIGASVELIKHLPEISEYSNKEELEFYARLKTDQNPVFKNIDQEFVLTAIQKDYHIAKNLVNHLSEISEYSNKEELVSMMIQVDYEASENLINHLSEISEYSNKEELVLDAVQGNPEVAENLINHLSEISEYSNKEELEFYARLKTDQNPVFKNIDQEFVLTAIQKDYNIAKNLINHLPEISEYSNKEKLFSFAFDNLKISYNEDKIKYIFDNSEKIESYFSKAEKEKYCKLNDYRVDFNSTEDVLSFRVNNFWTSEEKSMYKNIEVFLSEKDRKENYDKWLDEYLLTITKEEQQIFFAKTGLSKEYNSKNILSKYLPKDNYHMALDCFDERLFDQFEIQDLVQLLSNTIPKANPSDLGKDKYEIFKNILSDFKGSNFLDNFLNKYLSEEDILKLGGEDEVDKMRGNPEVMRRKPSEEEKKIINKKRKQIISEKFREAGLFDNLSKLYKETRLLSSFTEKERRLLEEFKKNEQVEVYNYFNYLLNHETASLDAMKNLLTNPEKFFSQASSYDGSGVNRLINPSNWTKIGDDRVNIGIDLEANDIRDIFMDGRLDEITQLSIFKKEYKANLTTESRESKTNENKEKIKQIENELSYYYRNESEIGGDLKKVEKENIQNEIQKKMVLEYFDETSLGEFLQKADQPLRKALAKISEEKVSEYNEVLKLNNLQKLINFVLDNVNLTTKYLLNNKVELKQNFQEDEELIDILKIQDIKEFTARSIDHFKKIDDELILDIEKKLKDKYAIDFTKDLVLRAEILMPSNPERPTVGNNTSSCDGFGDGKRIQYDFNPSCSQFAISFVEKLSNGKERINVVAQSLITLDSDIEDSQKIQEILKNPGNLANLNEKLGTDFLEKYYANKKVLSYDNIEVNNNFKGKILVDGSSIGNIYKDFTKELLAHNLQLQQDKFLTGTTCNDVNVISDLNAIDSKNSYLLSTVLPYTDKKGDSCNLIMTGLENNEIKKDAEKKSGVKEISFMDTFPVAYLEEKVYKENNAEELIEGLTKIQNLLIASSYACLKNDIDNLNKGYFDKEGILKGYLTAYPVVNNEDELSIYVHDLAVSKDSKMAGGRLMMDFMESIKPVLLKLENNTGQKNVSIKMTSKKDTAYPIIKSGAEKYGFKLVKDVEVNNEMMELEMVLNS